MVRKKMLMMCVGVMLVAMGGREVFAQEEVELKQEITDSQTSGNVSLDFVDADIQNVFKILSLKSGVNIIASPEVTGAISIQLDDVPWKQALDVILQNYGYAYEQKGNIIMVTTVDDLKLRRENAALLADQEPLVTKTFTLNFAKAADIIVSLDKMKSERGSIDSDERTNMLIITDISQKVELMSDIIEQLDKTTPQVLIESKIIETTLTDTDNLGIDWTIKASINGASRQVLTPFKVTGGAGGKYAGALTTPDSTTVNYGTLSFSQTQAVYEMLKTRVDTDILSNPKIVTLDNQPAVISIGNDTPIPSFGANTETGQLQTTGISYRNIGINFEVTPHVNNAGFITLEVKPEVSEKVGDVTMENVLVPVVSVERASTQVMIETGKTLVIAGLIKTKTTDTRKKVPFLGDVPFFGLMFQHKAKVVEKRDLLIFITPHIITLEVPTKD